VVGEESRRLLEDDDLPRRRQERPLERRQEVARAFHEPAGEGPEDIHPHRHAREVTLVLGGVADRRAHEISEVVEGEAGHDRVEVHHAEWLPGRGVEEHVGDLGVVVSGADGEIAALDPVDESAGHAPPVEESGRLATHRGGPARGVRAPRPLEGDEAGWRVVEPGDRLVERRLGEVGELAEEAAEGEGGGPGLGRRLCVLPRARPLDPGEEAPSLPVGVHEMGSPLPGGHEGEDPALAGGRALPFETARDVPSHPCEVLHHQPRPAKDEPVDVLEQEAGRAARTVPGHDPGLVDVSPRLGGDRPQPTLDRESLRDRRGGGGGRRRPRDGGPALRSRAHGDTRQRPSSPRGRRRVGRGPPDA
jgi:hypothetical protein